MLLFYLLFTHLKHSLSGFGHLEKLVSALNNWGKGKDGLRDPGWQNNGLKQLGLKEKV